MHTPQIKRQTTEFIQCENGANGLFPHPFDCTKFLQCDRGHTFLIECFAGTVFNDAAQICDWPRNVNCGARQFKGIAVSSDAYLQTIKNEPFRGEGIINIRTARTAPESYSQPIHRTPSVYSAPNQQNRPQIRNYQPQSPRLRSQNISPSRRPQPDSDRIIFIDSDSDYQSLSIHPHVHATNDIPSRTSVQNRPQVKIVKVSNNFPELNLMTRRVNDDFSKYFLNPKPKTHQIQSSDVNERPIILKILPQQLLDMNLMSKRVGNAFNADIVNPKPKTVLKLQSSPKSEIPTRHEPAPIDFITLVRQGTPYNHSAAQQFPQVNLMSPIVGNQFYRYFSFIRPKSTPKNSTTENSRPNDERKASQATPGKRLFHGELSLNRNISSPLENYNRLYYKPIKNQWNATTERPIESNSFSISDNLMQLLRPYLKEKNASKASNTINSNRADVETFTTTDDRKFIKDMHPSERKKPSARPNDWNVSHSVTTYRPQSSTSPTYHRPVAYDPNQIFFPGPHSQSHPMEY